MFIIEEYKKYCDDQEHCHYCKLNKNNCLVEFAYQLGRVHGIDEFREANKQYCIRVGGFHVEYLDSIAEHLKGEE